MQLSISPQQNSREFYSRRPIQAGDVWIDSFRRRWQVLQVLKPESFFDKVTRFVAIPAMH